MKQAVFVSNYIIADTVQVFKDNGREVYGAPYESDFQLVHWELSDFTQGTMTTDSDIFAMGSKIFIDLLNFSSANGKCKIVVRDDVLPKVLPGEYPWTHFDLLLYAALMGCDFIPRLYRVRTEAIAEFIV